MAHTHTCLHTSIFVIICYFSQIIDKDLCRFPHFLTSSSAVNVVFSFRFLHIWFSDARLTFFMTTEFNITVPAKRYQNMIKFHLIWPVGDFLSALLSEDSSPYTTETYPSSKWGAHSTVKTKTSPLFVAVLVHAEGRGRRPALQTETTESPAKVWVGQIKY